MNRKWPNNPEIIEFCQQMTDRFVPPKQQIEQLKQRFGIEMSYYQIVAYRQVNHIRIPKYWTDEMVDFIKEHAPRIEWSFKRIADEIRIRFNRPDMTATKVKNCVANKKIKTGRTGFFVKGHIPLNKGKRMSDEVREKCKSSWFKKNHRPHNEHPVGTQIFSHDGYLMQKVSDDLHIPKKQRWKPVHHIVWEQVNGPVPPGHIVIFLDGNRQNFSIDNLKLISRKTNAGLNQWGLRFDDAELTKTGIQITELKQTINKKRNKNE